jgi:hypothetical protein
MSQAEQDPGDPRTEPAMHSDDALPPVEPPSAGFIVKLFIVPAAIVIVVLTVVLGFNWLAQRGGNANSYVQAIENGAPNSWQCAHSLAKLLSTDERLRKDPELATRLSDLLLARVKSGPPLRKPVFGDKDDGPLGREAALRLYLCMALGNFAIPEALPALLEATRQDRNEDETQVRLAALQGSGTLASNAAQSGQGLASPELLQLLLSASREPNREIRERATTALAALGGPEALARLEQILLTELRSANVRFNAAIGLAQHGNAKCLDALAQMLDPDDTAGVDDEPDQNYKPQKQFAVHTSGLWAVEQLAQANPTADLRPLAEPLEKLRQREGVHPTLKGKAIELLGVIRARGQGGE